MLNGPEKEIKESSPDGEDDKKPVGENDEEEADDGDATADMTPLSAAVYNNHIDVVQSLLGRATPREAYDALLLSIAMGYEQITECFIRHPIYERARNAGKQLKKEEGPEFEVDEGPGGELFEGELTPLVLAAQKNQFDTVKLLIAKGERIEEPHSSACECEQCGGSPNYDELRFAQTRLNTFRALCSEAYIVHTSEDPILTAFERSEQMTNLSITEKNFMAQYTALVDNLQEFSHDMMDCVRNGEEQKTILKTGGTSGLKRDKLARLKLAIHFKHKKFVAHWVCQERLGHQFYGQYYFLDSANVFIKLLYLLLFIVVYPIAAILYLFWPKQSKASQFVETPLVKSFMSIMSYVFFLFLVVYTSVSEQSSEGIQLLDHPTVGPRYLEYCRWVDDSINQTVYRNVSDENGTWTGYNETVMNNATYAINNVWVRPHQIDPLTIIMTIWIIGMAWETFSLLIHEKAEFFFSNIYNVIDIISHCLYVISMALKFYMIFIVRKAMREYSEAETWIKVLNNDRFWVFKLGLLNADRHDWIAHDFMYFSDCMFAIASVLTVCRMTYILAFHHKTGPLVVSLSQMIVDAFWFMFLLFLLIFAFVIGIQNIHWYYSKEKRLFAEMSSENSGDDDRDYGTFTLIFKNMLFSLFGVVELDDFIIPDASPVINIMSQLLFATYEWIMIIILLNILIARMSETYENMADQEDMEWNFFSTMLLLEYMRDDGMLAVPFNLIPSPRDCLNCGRMIRGWCSKREKIGTVQNGNHDKEIFMAVMKRVTDRFIHRRTRVGDDDQGDGDKEASKKAMVTLEKNLERVRNDMASLRIQFFKTMHAEVTAESKKVMDRLAVMERQQKKEVEKMKAELNEQSTKMHSDIATEGKTVADKISNIEKMNRQEVDNLKSQLKEQVSMTSTSFEKQKDQVALAFSKMAAKEESLAQQLDDTKTKVNSLELILAKLPSEFLRLLEASGRRRSLPGKASKET